MADQTPGEKRLELWVTAGHGPKPLTKLLEDHLKGKLTVNNIQGASDWIDGFEVALLYFYGMGIDEEAAALAKARMLDGVHVTCQALQERYVRKKETNGKDQTGPS